MVATNPTVEEIEKGCRTIDFRDLRKPGTLVYLVVSEGAAEMYKEFIATFLGQAVLEMRLDGVNVKRRFADLVSCRRARLVPPVERRGVAARTS